MTGTERLSIAGAVSILLATLTLMPLTVDRSFLGWSLLLVGLMFVVGMVSRRLGLSDVGATISHLVMIMAFAVGFSMFVAPAATVLDGMSELTIGAVEHLQSQGAPMEPDPGVLWLTVLLVGFAYFFTDVLVTTLEHPAWGVVPSLTLFLIPTLSIQATGVLSALLIVGGYLIILLTASINATERWSSGVLADAHRPVRSAGSSLLGAAAMIAIPALVLSLLAWVIIPPGGIRIFPGGGNGGNGPLQLGDPTLDLRRNLVQPADTHVLNYTTTGPGSGGVYLRIASLPVFDSSGWHNAEIQVLDGQPGGIPGLLNEPPQRRTTTISIGDVNSEYLPLPYAPRRLDITGSWGYDPRSLVYIATGSNRGSATRNLQYTVESVDVQPNPSVLAGAIAGTPDDLSMTGPLPEGIPAEIVQLAEQITADQPTHALKAAAIQNYLRSSEFTYSTDPAPGSGYDALTNFLFRDKVGYCEQFSAAMAVMARAVGIPSRVAIGYLPGENVGGNQWEVTAHDLHAWPELYFAGLGWIPWEPTPGNGATAPEWTNQEELQPSLQPTASTTPSASSSADTANPDTLPTEELNQNNGGTTADAGAALVAAILRALAVVAVLGLILAVMAAPAVIRRRRTQQRFSAGQTPVNQINQAWSEVRDVMVDSRHDWPSGSPRTIAQQLSAQLRLGDPEPLRQLAVLVERARFAPHESLSSSDAEPVRSYARSVIEAVKEPQSRWQRIRSAMIPRSLWQSR